MSTIPALKVVKFLGDSTALQDLYNNHFGYTSGDPLFWEDYASSPIFPVNEQPESDKFYILYNFADSMPSGEWWHLDTTLMVYVASNNINLLGEFGVELIKLIGDYEFAADRINQWAADNNVEGPHVNYMGYGMSDPITPQEQENGVYSRLFELTLNSVVC